MQVPGLKVYATTPGNPGLICSHLKTEILWFRQHISDLTLKYQLVVFKTLPTTEYLTLKQWPNMQPDNIRYSYRKIYGDPQLGQNSCMLPPFQMTAQSTTPLLHSPPPTQTQLRLFYEVSPGVPGTRCTGTGVPLYSAFLLVTPIQWKSIHYNSPGQAGCFISASFTKDDNTVLAAKYAW